MSELASPEFLSRMEALYPKEGEQAGTWAPIVATAFSASNAPEAVPLVFQHAVRGLESRDERLLLVRKMKDAVFKSGMLSGYPKAINALIHLNTVLPDDLRDAAPLRDLSLTTSDLNRIGQEHFSRTYGDTTETVQSLLREIYPDLGLAVEEHFSTTFAYGYTYGFSQVLSAAETSFAMVAALIATDTPRQIECICRGDEEWRESGRGDGGAADLDGGFSVAGVVWKGDIPDI
ncbi:hypothetical protein BD779DRAFT_475657 [Infundibulicybe gibba]|nr:hypothetical protein BD779DRAFT_475657 [Infundibulicybe gibba]